MSLDEKNPKTGRRRDNPMKPTRNFKSYATFLGIAVIIVFLVDFIVFKGERPYLSKIKQDYYTQKALEEKAVEEALPPKIVYPDSDETFFEAPKELKLKEEQSLLPEKMLNIETLIHKIEKEEAVQSDDAVFNKSKSQASVPVVKKPYLGKIKKIAIVIDDVGMNLEQSHAAIDLPAEVTLAMLPYAAQVRGLSKQAIREGHELIVHTPMEAMNKEIDLGSLALYSDMDDAAFNTEFEKILNSFDGYVGINNHMGSRLTQDNEMMTRLMRELKKRELYFLDSRTIATSVAAQTAQQNGVLNATRDVFLDHEDTDAFLKSALIKTEKVAAEHGYAIAIGHPKKVTMDALEEWIPTLKNKGFELVALSEIINIQNGVSDKNRQVASDNITKKTKQPQKANTAYQIEARDSINASKIMPSAGEERNESFSNLVGELTPEDEQVIIKPIDVQNEETGSFIVREPTKKIIMERGLPKISFPVE